jgi:predicted N-acetyltransferase YhbS
MRINSERLSAQAYIEFLKRTDLGSQYPRERFEERIDRLVRSASISLVARDDAGEIVGVCFGITDFAYWLFITDLGVARDWVKQGVGRRLMRAALEAAGGEKDIIVYTCANKNAVGFYERLGMVRADDVMVYNHTDWTGFVVE